MGSTTLAIADFAKCQPPDGAVRVATVWHRLRRSSSFLGGALLSSCACQDSCLLGPAGDLRSG